jgi:hypothetical protein
MVLYFTVYFPSSPWVWLLAQSITFSEYLRLIVLLYIPLDVRNSFRKYRTQQVKSCPEKDFSVHCFLSGQRVSKKSLWTNAIRLWHVRVQSTVHLLCHTSTDSLSPPNDHSPQSNVRQLINGNYILIILATSWDDLHSYWSLLSSLFRREVKILKYLSWEKGSSTCLLPHAGHTPCPTLTPPPSVCKCSAGTSRVFYSITRYLNI